MLRPLLTLTLAAILAGCGAEAARAPVDTLVRLSEDEVKSLDPRKASDLTSLRVAGDLFEGLTRNGADGRVEPGLAERWSVSPDGRTWTFALRDGLRWSDGRPLVAGDLADSFRTLRAQVTASPNASLFDAVAAVEAPDTRTVTVRLHQPYPALLELLAHPAAAAIRFDGREPRSSGSYRLLRWRIHDRIELAANPAYWDAARVGARKVAWLPVEDRQTAMRMFRAGAADTVPDFPSGQLALLRERVPRAVRIAPYRGVQYWPFNTRRPPFDDVRVRRALSMAVERDKITGKLLGTGVAPARSIVPPGVGGYGPAVEPVWAAWPIERRLAEARRLLASAGYGPGRPLVIEARFASDPDNRRVAVALASFWKPLGVTLRAFNTEATLHFAALRAGDFDLARASWIADIDAPENVLSVHRSEAGPINYSGYRSPAFDRALAAALAEPDPRRRTAAMRAAERILVEDAPVLPIYFYVSKNLVSPRVDGWRDNLANVHPTRTLRIDGPSDRARNM
jgi:peptide/nickel transport system substrate-binding protein/oligopeptide transport system substrate-binding protein